MHTSPITGGGFFQDAAEEGAAVLTVLAAQAYKRDTKRI